MTELLAPVKVSQSIFPPKELCLSLYLGRFDGIQDHQKGANGMINKINNLFFPLEDERLNISDGLWFYGILIGAVVWTAFVVIATW